MGKKRKDTRPKGKWHGWNKKNYDYEGNQYTAGREKGKKNLKKIEGGVENEHGVQFTNAEKKALEIAVNSANRKRKRLIENEAKLPRTIGGRDTGDTIASLHSMGSTSDFIIARRSKYLHQFKSREAFESYMENMKKVNSRDYLNNRTELYKQNHITALENVFGHDAEDVIEAIRKMKPAVYRKKLQSDEFLEVGFVYDPGDAAGKLNAIRAAMGMPLQEDPI